MKEFDEEEINIYCEEASRKGLGSTSIDLYSFNGDTLE